MWRDKKPVVPERPSPVPVPVATPMLVSNPIPAPPEKSNEVETMAEPIKTPVPVYAEQSRTQLGRSMVVKGDLSGKEDLLISGEFTGPSTCKDIV